MKGLLKIAFISRKAQVVLSTTCAFFIVACFKERVCCRLLQITANLLGC